MCGVAFRLRLGPGLPSERDIFGETGWGWYHEGRRGMRAGAGFAGILTLMNGRTLWEMAMVTEYIRSDEN